MNNNKKIILVLIGIILVAVVAVAAIVNKGGNNGGNNNAQVESTQSPAGDDSNKQVVQPASTLPPEKVYTPTFMYFVSKKDALYNDAMAVYKALEAEYKEKVKFELKDIDENPELTKNFPIGEAGIPTPTLIMLDTKNNICSLGLASCVDKDKLKAEIEKALAVK